MGQSEKLYKPVLKEGTHLAKSKNTPGAVRGSTLSDENNQLAGQAEWIEVEVEPEYIYVESESKEDDGLSEETKAIIDKFANELVELGFLALQKYVFPHIKSWATNTAAPQIKRAWHWITGKKDSDKAQKTKTAHNTTTAIIPTSESMPLMLTKGLDIAYEKYTDNSSDDDAKRDLLEIAMHSAMLADKIKKFLVKYAENENIISADFLEWQRVVEKVTSKNLVECLNLILKTNVSLINNEQSSFLSDILGYDVVRNGRFVPIKNDRFAQALSLKSAA